MKTFAIVTCALFLAAPALAGEMAVTPSTLDSMGLAGMHQLSDHDGLAVRGKGPFDNMPWAVGNWPFPTGQTHGVPTGPPSNGGGSGFPGFPTPPSSPAPNNPSFPNFPPMEFGSIFGQGFPFPSIPSL